MKRRNFIKAGSLSAAAMTASTISAASIGAMNTTAQPFSLKYAPHLGMFKHHAGENPLDQIQFMADQGFSAFEDNNMKSRTPEMQAKMGDLLAKNGMDMGVFVAHAEWKNPSFTTQNTDWQNGVLAAVEESVEVAKRCNAKWMTVVPGLYDIKLEWDYQTANCIELLKRCAAILEPHDLVMVLEPLNWRTNHPQLFLHKIPQAYLICQAVGSPSCKILDDLYHQQIQEGNLIPNMEMAWDEIAYIQVGDNPGRKEPTTGEINYQNIFKWLSEKGFNGIIGMEHGNSKEGKAGEQAVIDAYRWCDAF